MDSLNGAHGFFMSPFWEIDDLHRVTGPIQAHDYGQTDHDYAYSGK